MAHARRGRSVARFVSAMFVTVVPVVVKQKFGMTMVPNRYIRDEMQFDRDAHVHVSGAPVDAGEAGRTVGTR